jgi:hypothetical protein
MASRKLMPVIATIENKALGTADTAVNVTLFSPPLSTSSVLERFVYNLRTIDVTVKDGNTACTVYGIVRKLPAGYTAPSIVISDAVTTFADVDNVLAYSIYNGSQSTLDPWDRLIWRYLRKTFTVNSGDSIILQMVTDTSSATQTFSVLAEYNVGV